MCINPYQPPKGELDKVRGWPIDTWILLGLGVLVVMGIARYYYTMAFTGP